MDAGTVTILAACLGPIAGAAAAKYLKPKASLSTRLDTLEADFRMLQDYSHELRNEIVSLGGTPPPWPEGLTK